MDDFYHLDSTGSALRPGMTIDWMPVPTECTSDIRTPLNHWFPKGVTRFGIDIILGQLEELALEREHELETIRRENHAHLPSRYTSVFACRSTEDIALLRCQFDYLNADGKRGRVWRVAGKGLFRADMNLFKKHHRDMRTAAARYWLQEATEEPLYEHLLEPPVMVLEEVDETTFFTST
jgi:hypothetical protein